jgi:hypothetical protein
MSISSNVIVQILSAASLLCVAVSASASMHPMDAKDFARNTLTKVRAAEQLIRPSELMPDAMYQTEVKQPLEQLLRRWQRADAAVVRYAYCGHAASLLLHIGNQTHVADWERTQWRKFDAAIDKCRRSIYK